MDLWLRQCRIYHTSSLTLEEEGVEFEDERAVCRPTCEFMEWALVLVRMFVQRHRCGANGGPLHFRCENTDTGTAPSCHPHCSASV